MRMGFRESTGETKSQKIHLVESDNPIQNHAISPRNMEQNPFTDSAPGFAENPEPRCASVLLLDVSGSMGGVPLQQLQEGLSVYKDELFADTLARKRVEIAIVTFGGTVQVAQPFTTTEYFTPPTLIATGETPMAAAVITALDLLRSRKDEYKTNGIGYYRPWVFLITDGAPTDMNTPQWPEALTRVREGEEKKAFSFFAVGVEGADMERLKELSPKRDPLKLKGLRFRDLFVWLSSSQQSVSRSKPDDAVPLQNPSSPEGWATV
jgi:uncharacterized protein YegL